MHEANGWQKYDGRESNQHNQMTTIENTGSKNKRLRFYTGTWERRNMMLPVYRARTDGNAEVVSYHVESSDTVEIFMVRGFGATREQSEFMAERGGR